MKRLRYLILFIALAGMGAVLLSPGLAQPPTKRYKVKIDEEKAEIVERLLPVDPRIRIGFNLDARLSFNVTAEGKRYSNNVSSSFMIDGTIYMPDNVQVRPIPDGPNKKKRTGSQAVWQQGNIRITTTMEVVPGKPWKLKPGEPIPRRMDTFLAKYTVENLGKSAHKVGCRMLMDVDVLNDQALFASPVTHPKEILNGIALEGKKLPPFFMAIQRSDLNNPGETGVFTLKLGNKLEGPNKAILTNLGAAFGDWDAPAEQAGDSACVFLWHPQVIPPGGKRECAYGYGQGIVSSNDAQVNVSFGGSFEPAKRFTITAQVTDPVNGQTLTLLLPKGIERIDGKETQLVPTPLEGTNSIVMWRCSLVELGSHPIRIRSSTGETKTWTVTVSPSK